jgi:hypothetical protein
MTVRGQLRLFEIPPCRSGDARCVDCGVDTVKAGEMYMVLDEVWPLDQLGGMLCVGCLESRIGRRLTPADFSGVPINHDRRARSARLDARQRRAA